MGVRLRRVSNKTDELMATIFCLCGENTFLKKKKIDELKKEILEPRAAVLNYEIHQALVDDFISLKENLCSLSFFNQKLILVNDADRFNASQLKEIFSLARKNKSLTLILNSDKKDFSQQIPPPYKANVKTFKKIYSNEIPSWLRQRIKEKGSDMSPAAAEILAQNLGNNLQLLDLTLDTLINFVDKKRRIEKEDVEKLVGLNLGENIFSLVEAVADRNVNLALKLASSILGGVREPHQILGILAWNFTRLLIARKIMAKYKDFEGRKKIQKIFSLRTFFVAKFMRQVNSFTLRQLKGSLRCLLQADTDIKTLAVNPQYILEIAIVNLCAL